MTGPAATAGARTNASDKAMSRSDLLRALVRAHQHLVEERLQVTRIGAAPGPQIERDLAAIAERITNLLSNSEENGAVIQPPMRARNEHLFEEPLKEAP